MDRNFSRQHIAVVGDASIASGMAFEALNHAGVSNTNILVILNDNAIGIDPSVGALKEYLSKVTLDHPSDEINIFEALNFKYTGPIDGHDLPQLLVELERLKERSCSQKNPHEGSLNTCKMQAGLNRGGQTTH